MKNGNRFSRINAYDVMWIFVFFDLPTHTKVDRKKASDFRKNLIGDGYTMMQFSIYTRHCPSRENATVHVNRLKKLTPKKGHLSILQITDKQYGSIINTIGWAFKPLKKAPGQLEMF